MFGGASAVKLRFGNSRRVFLPPAGRVGSAGHRGEFCRFLPQNATFVLITSAPMGGLSLHFTKTADFQFFPESVRAKSTSKSAGDNELRKSKGAHNTNNGSGMNMSKRITGDLVRPSDVITIPTSSLNIGHPAVYPIGLPEFFIKLMSKEGDVVVDPFLGSGTTALVALKLGRRFLGIERSE